MTITLSLTVFLCILGIALLYIIWAFHLVYKLYKADQLIEKLETELSDWREEPEEHNAETCVDCNGLSIREQAMEEIRELGRQDAIAGRPNRLDKPEYDYLMSEQNDQMIKLEHFVKKAQEDADDG